MHDILVSVIMAVHNGEVFLTESIESVLNQSHKNLELIIIDDASTDNTHHILNDYKKRSNIKIFYNLNNIGLTKSLNKGIESSAGKYIARIDADDVWLPQKLELQLKYLVSRPGIFLSGTNFLFIDEVGEIIQRTGTSELSELITPDLIKRLLTRYNPFCHSSIVFDRAILSLIGRYNERYKYGQDYEFWVRINLKFDSVIIGGEPLVYKRITENIIGIKRRRIQSWYGFKAACKAILKYEKKYVTAGSYLSCLKKLFRAFTPNFLANAFK
ncbi:MAG: glycosyltransferase [Ferruginibacter sp.]